MVLEGKKMNLSENLISKIELISKKSEIKLKEGKNYIKYYDKYFQEKSYTFVSNFFSFDKNKNQVCENFFYEINNKPEFMPKNLVPISSIGNGDYLCINYKNESYEVYYWCHELEENNLYLICRTLDNFPSMLLDKNSLDLK